MKNDSNSEEAVHSRNKSYNKILHDFIGDLKQSSSNFEVLFSALFRALIPVLNLSAEKTTFAVLLYENFVDDKLNVAYFESSVVTAMAYDAVLKATVALLADEHVVSTEIRTKDDIAHCAPHAPHIPDAVLIIPITLMQTSYGFVVVYDHGDKTPLTVDDVPMVFISGIIHMVALVCQSRTNTERFEHYLMNDHLTELPNRTHVYEAIIHQLQMAEVFQIESRFAILIIKVNGLKHINDSLGMATGDMVLKSMAAMLKSIVLDVVVNGEHLGSLVGRLSGGDFVVLVMLSSQNRGEQADQDAVKAYCEAIIQKTKDAMEINDHKLYLTANIGASIYPHHGETAEALLRKADLAKSVAKTNGPSAYMIYEHFMDGDAEKVLFLNSNLPGAIASNQFELFYQPQIDVKTGDVIGAEALIRWRHPEKGLIFPGDFIAFAESNAYGIQIDKLVLEMACEQIIKWRKKGIGLTVSVNISPRHFANGLICDTIRKVITDKDVEPSQLKIELLESVLVNDFEGTVKVINALRDLGINIALDDFGAGYSSLEYVAKLPLDYLKIDRTFPMNMEKNPTNAIILKTIMTLAKGMAVKTVAEGVENAVQLAFLREIGCDMAQGYFISKPLDVASFEAKFLK